MTSQTVTGIAIIVLSLSVAASQVSLLWKEHQQRRDLQKALAYELASNLERLEAFWRFANRSPRDNERAESSWVFVTDSERRKLDAIVPVWDTLVWDKNISDFAKALDDSAGSGAFKRTLQVYRCLKDLNIRYNQVPRPGSADDEAKKEDSQKEAEQELRLATWRKVEYLHGVLAGTETPTPAQAKKGFGSIKALVELIDKESLELLLTSSGDI